MKKIKNKALIIIEYVWICPNVPKQTAFWICLEFLNAEILNIVKFWIKVFQNASVTQPTEYARITLTETWMLNMEGFWTCKNYTGF